MTEFERILVPLDGSPLAERAIPLATALAEKFESEIFLLRVLDIPEATAPAQHLEVTIGWVREARAQAHDQARRYLDERQREIYRQGIAVRALVRDRSAPEDILELADSEKIDLIVMSAHGQGGGPAGPLAVWPTRWHATALARCCSCVMPQRLRAHCSGGDGFGPRLGKGV
jgi:nucleotide-binding universal stress UspA family protein